MKPIYHFLFLFMFLFTACAPVTAPAATQPNADVTFMVSGDPIEFAAYQMLVDAFHAAHPEIRVGLTHVPSDSEYRQKLAVLFAAGNPPDVMLLNYRRYPQFAASGGLKPLTEFFDASDVFELGDFFPAATEAFIWQDELWCVPQNLSSLVVYYNQTLFDRAGLDYPADNWTWDEFLNTARALTLDNNGNGVPEQYGAGIDPSLYRLAPFVWQNGGEIVDNPLAPSYLTLSSEPALTALRWFIELQTHWQVVPNQLAEQSESSESRFLNARTAMFFSSRRFTPILRASVHFKWDVAPLPQGKVVANVLHSDGYCMAANAKNPKAAWAFIEFANSPEGQTLMLATGRTVPSLLRVAQSEAFLQPQVAPLNSRVFVESAQTLRRVPLHPQWVAIEEAASKEIERAFYGIISPEEAARLADERTRELFR